MLPIISLFFPLPTVIIKGSKMGGLDNGSLFNNESKSFIHFYNKEEYDTHDPKGHVLPFHKRRSKIAEILAAHDIIFGLAQSGACATFSGETNKRICFLNISPDEVIRSLFFNKNKRIVAAHSRNQTSKGRQDSSNNNRLEQRQFVVRRFLIAIHLDLMLILKLAAVIFLFNQDGSRKKTCPTHLFCFSHLSVSNRNSCAIDTVALTRNAEGRYTSPATQTSC